MLQLTAIYNPTQVCLSIIIIAAKDEVALSYHTVRGLYFPAVICTAPAFNDN